MTKKDSLIENAVKQNKNFQIAYNEEEDCLVNILDQDETNIEVQPTLTHNRYHLSTENLFKECQNTIEILSSFKNRQIQK